MSEKNAQVGKAMSNFENSSNDVFPEKNDRKYLVTSRLNRSIEVHLRNKTLKFDANGELTLSEDEIKSDAFQQQMKNFNIKGV